MFVCVNHLANGANEAALSGYASPVLLAASTHHHHFYDLTWVEWVTVVGLPLTLFGLIITWRQARTAANAATAAKNAVYRTEQQIRASQLLVLIPQLRWIVAELEAAMEKDNDYVARRQLDSWRWQAGNIHGILSGANPSERRLLKSLTQSTALAVTAGGLLLEANGSVTDRCMKARAAMAAACDELASWVGKHATQAVQDGG
jgi:hypothetical protein